MGVPQKAIAYIKPDEYLALEEMATTKHEYLDGVIYAWQGYASEAMAGGSKDHNLICLNICFALRQRLQGTPCRVYMTDVKLQIEEANAYFYPDVMVTCAPSDLSPGDPLSVREPTIIFEVLSDSTEGFDRGEKLAAYQRIASLHTYVLVPMPGRPIDVFERSAGGVWKPLPASSGGVPLTSLGTAIPSADIYSDV